MRHARHEITDANQEFANAETDSAVTLDETAVLQHLEAGLRDEHSDDPIAGILNGVMISAVMWIVMLSALLAVFWER